MKPLTIKKMGLLMALAVTLLLASVALAANGYDISWWTVDGGGGISQSADGVYTMHGTIGQPDAGVPMSGEDYTLTGGFWGGAGPTGFDVFLPLVTR